MHAPAHLPQQRAHKGALAHVCRAHHKHVTPLALTRNFGGNSRHTLTTAAADEVRARHLREEGGISSQSGTMWKMKGVVCLVSCEERGEAMQLYSKSCSLRT